MVVSHNVKMSLPRWMPWSLGCLLSLVSLLPVFCLASLPFTAMADTAMPIDFRRETIYFVLTARFADGDPSNNFYNRDRIKLGDPQWRGDFKGLINHLDYIKDLGFTAIWISPPVENRSGLDYHGYHAYDWTRVDPRLESPGATYQDLIDAAHANGLKVIQDVVINHSSNYGIRNQVWIDRLPHKYFRPAHAAFTAPYALNLGNYLAPYHEDNDNPVAPAWFRERQHQDDAGDVPFIDPTTGLSLAQFKQNPNRFFNTDVAHLPTQWYHPDGYMAGGDWENPNSLQRKHLSGDCMDLATERPIVKAYLNSAILSYLNMGVDAIRLDTAKHVERDELLTYVHTWQEHRPGLFVFAEVMVKGLGYGDLEGNDNGPSAIRPWWYTRNGHDAKDPHSGGDSGLSVIDFALFSTFRDNLTKGNFDGLGGVFAHDWIYGDATKLVTFFQNHDVGPDNDFKYRFGAESWRAAVAYNLLWTARGIPALYYGEEIEFMKGAPQDIAGEHDTLDQTGRAYFGEHLTPEGQRASRMHPMYRHIQRLNLIRQRIPALQTGAMSQVHEFGSGISYVREDAGSDSYVVVGLAADRRTGFTVAPVRNGTYVDAVSGCSRTVHDGRLIFGVKAHSAGIWVLGGTSKIGDDGAFLQSDGC